MYRIFWIYNISKFLWGRCHVNPRDTFRGGFRPEIPPRATQDKQSDKFARRSREPQRPWKHTVVWDKNSTDFLLSRSVFTCLSGQWPPLLFPTCNWGVVLSLMKWQSKARQNRTGHLEKGNSARESKVAFWLWFWFSLWQWLWFVVCRVYRERDHYPQPVCGDTNLQEGLCSREFKNTVADGLEAVATSNWTLTTLTCCALGKFISR